MSVMHNSIDELPMVGVISSTHNRDIQSLANSRIPYPSPYGLSKTRFFAVRNMIIKLSLITCKLLQVPRFNSRWTSLSLWQKTAYFLLGFFHQSYEFFHLLIKVISVLRILHCKINRPYHITYDLEIDCDDWKIKC